MRNGGPMLLVEFGGPRNGGPMLFVEFGGPMLFVEFG